jgi:hypothetical protein
MLLENNISEKAKMKLRLYGVAMFLFEKGKSHPQIVAILQEYEPDYTLVVDMVDKAMHDEWDKLYEEARVLLSEGMNYDKVLTIISKKEPDIEIATWICNNWYNLKSLLAECIVDGSTNRFEGMKWIIICAIAIPIFFYIGSSWMVKGMWILALVASLIQWIVGMQQRDIQNTIQQILALDIQNRDDKEKLHS